jgi:hypothetical protein
MTDRYWLKNLLIFQNELYGIPIPSKGSPSEPFVLLGVLEFSIYVLPSQYHAYGT